MSTLRSVVYVSSANGAVTADDLELLLVQARQFNLKSGVTGVLLYANGSYMQCFEGEEEAVNRTYARILDSRQHRNIIELMNAPVAQRSFAGWQMALVKPHHSTLLSLSAGEWQQTASCLEAGLPSASMGLELLKAFWEGARR